MMSADTTHFGNTCATVYQHDIKVSSSFLTKPVEEALSLPIQIKVVPIKRAQPFCVVLEFTTRSATGGNKREDAVIRSLAVERNDKVIQWLDREWERA